MIGVGPLGLTTDFGAWPALVVSVVVGLILGLIGWRLHGWLPLRARDAGGEPGYPSFIPAPPRLPTLPSWSHVVLWGAFAVVVGAVATRP
jgi:hypothetical protein